MKRFSIFIANQFPPLEHIATGLDAALATLLKVRANHPGEVVLAAAEDCEDDPRRGLTEEEWEVLA